MSESTLTREELEQRLAALHRASLELIQDVSLETLLERIAVLACEQSGARYAAVGVLNEQGRLEQFIPVGMSQEDIQLMEHPPVGAGLIGMLMHTKETLRIPKIADDPRSAGFPPHHPPMTSFLGVPIYQGDRQLGQIYLTNKKNGSEFTSADQQVIETLAAYAAVAISNAQFYRQLTEHDRELAYRNENLALINHMAATLASSTDTGEILENSLSQVMDYLHLDVGEVFLREGESQTLKLVQHRGSLANSMWTQEEFKVGEGVVGETARSGQPVLLNLTNPGGQEIKYGLINGAFKQVACFPLTGRQGMLGVFCIANCQPQPLEDTEVQFLSAISSWMGTAIENVRLNLQQRRLAVLEERDRIGMDLHDGIIQSIYAVGLTLEHARLLMKDTPEQSYQRIEQAIADLDNTIRDIRAYILDLRPRQLFDENLMLGISRLVHEFRTNTLAEVKLDGPVGDLGLGEPEAVALFHICQEALANAAKHARARRLQVSVWKTADRVLLEINDDGRGFDTEKVRMALGHGLSNMSTRARNVGGDVDISSEPGSGTTVLAWVPLPHE